LLSLVLVELLLLLDRWMRLWLCIQLLLLLLLSLLSLLLLLLPVLPLVLLLLIMQGFLLCLCFTFLLYLTRPYPLLRRSGLRLRSGQLCDLLSLLRRSLLQ
ncbi:hypothetical protein Vafri_982, partial [Volvox africanus]